MNGFRVARFFGAFGLAALSGVSLAACDGDGQTTGGGGDGGGGAGGGSSRGVEYASALCDQIFECCNAADVVELFGGDGSVVDYAGCRILYRTTWEAFFEPTIADSEAKGRLEFDEDAFEACLKSFGGTCNGLELQSSLCENVFIPKVETGGPCAISLECKTGTCEIPDGAAEGTCVATPPPVGLGGDCSGGQSCATGLYCGNGMCAAVKADGQACQDDDECQSGRCVGDQQGPGQCGTICEGGGPGPGPIDAELETLGAPLASAQCGQIFECCDSEERQVLLFPGTETEAECRGLFGAFAALAMVQLHNDVAESKVSVDADALGGCIEKYGALSCQDFSKGVDLECPGAIEGLVADGGSCTSSQQCKSQFCNEPMPGQGKCEAVADGGAVCTGACVDGFHCDAGVCVAKKDIGEVCGDNNECAQGRCLAPASGDKVCTLICDGQ